VGIAASGIVTSSSLELFLGQLQLLHHDFENLKQLVEHKDGAVITSQTCTPTPLKVVWMLMRNFLDLLNNHGESLSLKLLVD
jgi:hypothetical protein